MTAGAPVRGVILAGGGATRFGGEPKGLRPVGGERILDRLARELTAALGAPPLLVANDPGAAHWLPGLRVVPDRRPGEGALGGILTAVCEAPAPCVVVAWDMPFVSAALVRALADGLARHDAMLPESDSRRGREPLCAAYGPRCRAAIEAALARGDRRAIAFHGDVDVGILPLSEVAALGDPARLFFNVNTPEDLQEAEALWRLHGSSRS